MPLQFFVSLIIIIFFHELAHLIVAKKLGCEVEVFSIGFGRAIWKKKIGNTLYQIAPILLGGYCQLKGELEVSDNPNSFSNLRYFKKVMIVLAGVIVNIIMGILCKFIGLKLLCYNLYYFGYLSLLLGIGNAIPFPALDGSYPILVWLEKIHGKEKGYRIMKKIVSIGFSIIWILNIVCLLLFGIYLIRKGI